MNRALSLLLAVLWLATANHCFVVTALAQPAKALHDCCKDASEKNFPKSKSGHHASNDVCCQLFVQNVKVPAELAAPAFLPALQPLAVKLLEPISEQVFATLLPSCDSPPGALRKVFHSLSSAPNAPPYSI